MKTTTILIFLLVLNISWSQSKEETLDWLNWKLDEYYSKVWREEYKIKVSQHPIDGEIIYIETFRHDIPRGSFYYFRPSSISRISTTRKKGGENHKRLDIEFFSKTKSIIHKSYYTGEIENLESFIMFIDGDDETVERIKKGFLHLSKLMGSDIPENQELFKG